MTSEQTSTPAVPKAASTVLCVRDGDAGLEVYLIRRVKGMPFAGGMTAYPGGGVDPRDIDADFEWVGPGPSFWADAFACDEKLAKALVAAAVRETFEEVGVLLATEPGGEVFDVSSDEWEAERVALVNREHSLSELLQRRGLVLRADLVAPWAHWITPEAEPRRYDTRFFLMKVPEGVHPREIHGEYDLAEWVGVHDAIAQADAGERTMMPPTIFTLRDLSKFETTDEALAAAPPRPITPIQPTLVRHEGTNYVQMPDGSLMRPAIRID
ncbi:NUDIX hydrolase [Epidermidibacterium keratini]|uniref:NUDIX hydrolase n=1 Tax=Epidermidibacterium keratini TaxID=1891644 RepID=UPI001CEFA726|nr:NUDIX domain-containing protein [Epidermidibacterium keratini]